MLVCPRGGMVDTRDLKSLGCKAVPVRVRPRAPLFHIFSLYTKETLVYPFEKGTQFGSKRNSKGSQTEGSA